jgi:chorismate-pyruvate lyase
MIGTASDLRQDLVERYFVMQEERPAHVQAVQIEAIDPLLRGLLFTDGTVTRALGAQTLSPVSVDRIGQLQAPLPPAASEFLEMTEGEEAVRRQVSIGVGAPPETVLWAESYMVYDRLPPGFLGLLDTAPDGIGQSLQRFSLESSRELLWFGLDSVPEWVDPAPGGPDGTLRRLYRIVSDRRPAILISEFFAVERRAGIYHLAGVGRLQRSEERR